MNFFPSVSPASLTLEVGMREVGQRQRGALPGGSSQPTAHREPFTYQLSVEPDMKGQSAGSFQLYKNIF